MAWKTTTILFILAAISAATDAYAYIGPGAGLSAIGSALALVGALFLMLVGFVWYPVKRLMRGRKTAGAAEAEDTDTSNSPAHRRGEEKLERREASSPEHRPGPSTTRR